MVVSKQNKSAGVLLKVKANNANVLADLDKKCQQCFLSHLFYGINNIWCQFESKIFFSLFYFPEFHLNKIHNSRLNVLKACLNEKNKKAEVPLFLSPINSFCAFIQ